MVIMDATDEPTTLQHILRLHEDRPDVIRKVKRAFQLLYERKPDSQTPKAVFLQSLLTILENCGDFAIQTGVVQLILAKEDVNEYKEWFAQQWFAGMPKTISDFIALVHRGEDQTISNISNFIMTFNMERPLEYVCSMPICNVKWNKVPIPQSRRGRLIVHLNCGTLTLSITGADLCLPKELATRGSFFLKCSEVQFGEVYSLLDPFDTETVMVSVKSSVGHLLFLLDPLPSDAQWQTMQEFFLYIFKFPLEFKDGASRLNTGALNDNMIAGQITQPPEVLANPEDRNNAVELVQEQPVKSLVSSSSQDHYSINCLEPKVLPNEEDIQMCDQFSRESQNESSNSADPLPSRDAVAFEPVNEDLAGNNHDTVGSTCDDQSKPRTTKRRSSVQNKGTSKQKMKLEIETEMTLSSTQDLPPRRETRSLSLSRSRGQVNYAEDGPFKTPKQKRGGGGGRGKGRGGSTNKAGTITHPHSSSKHEYPALNEASTSAISPPEKHTQEALNEACTSAISPPEKHSQEAQPAFAPIMTVDVSHSTDCPKVLSMPTLCTPYATPQHEFSNQDELKIATVTVNGESLSQPILKSHETLLTEFEACEALRAGPPPAIPLYAPSNFFSESSLPKSIVGEDYCSPQSKKFCSESTLNDIESDTSLLESAVQSAVLLPSDQYASVPVMSSPENQTVTAEIDDNMDPLKLDECTGSFN
ncbi:hypothetical protein FOCC_FOCC009291 [Frankliniella occidentalis]|nr:hypothetical protein FOCC_FOCC009291 [Frankliniella occidentalis]